MIVHLPRLDDMHAVKQVRFFAGKDFVLTWRERPDDCFDPVRERVQTIGRVLRQSGPDYLLCALLDSIIDKYFPALEEVGKRLDTLDEEMESGAGPNIIRQVHGVRHDVRLLRRVVWLVVPHKSGIHRYASGSQ